MKKNQNLKINQPVKSDSILKENNLIWTFWAIFGIYLCSSLSILRADYKYMDDLNRVLFGYTGWMNFSRYISEHLSKILNGGSRLTDISPLPQLLAILFMAVSATILINLFIGRKCTWLQMISSGPLYLTPYFTECISFKFDAPYMALSVFFSVLPFWFFETNLTMFVVTSFVCTIAVLSSYQAASGAFILILIFALVKDYFIVSDEKTFKIKKYVYGVMANILGMLFYKIFLLKPFTDNYVNGTLGSVSSVFWNIVHNLNVYAHTLRGDMPNRWLYCIVFLVLWYLLVLVFNTKKNKLICLAAGMLAIGISFCGSYGIYLMMPKPIFEPRAMIGFGVWLTLICLFIVSIDKGRYIGYFGVIALSWMLFVFQFTYGNNLKEHQRYIDFRVALTLTDFNRIFQNSNDELLVQFKGDIGRSPVINGMLGDYPVLHRIDVLNFGDGPSCYNRSYFFGYFGLKNIKDVPRDLENFENLNLPVVLDTRFHKFQSSSNKILITLK